MVDQFHMSKKARDEILAASKRMREQLQQKRAQRQAVPEPKKA